MGYNGVTGTMALKGWAGRALLACYFAAGGSLHWAWKEEEACTNAFLPTTHRKDGLAIYGGEGERFR